MLHLFFSFFLTNSYLLLLSLWILSRVVSHLLNKFRRCHQPLFDCYKFSRHSHVQSPTKYNNVNKSIVHQRGNSRTAWKISWCLSHQPLLMVSPQLRTVMSGLSPPTMLSPPLKTSTGLHSRTKGVGWSTALYHQALTRPAADVTMLVCPTLALSATNLSVISMDHSLFDLCSWSQAIMMNTYRCPGNCWLFWIQQTTSLFHDRIDLIWLFGFV